MDRNFQRALSLVLKHEGGFVDHPRDPGGATNKGVTIGTFRRYVKTNGTVADLKAITNEQVALVYRRHYWNAVKADELPSGVDYAVFDFAVNSGPGRAARYLQACIGAAVDGAIGPQTIAACRQLPADQIIENLCDDRMDFLRALKTWKTFGKGWTNRVTGVRKEALLMAVDKDAPSKPETPKPPPQPVADGFMAWLRRFLAA
jgi:lysozyme family protein